MTNSKKYDIIIIEIKERGKQKMLKDLLIEQFARNEERYEIECNLKNKMEVWDNELKKSIEFRFDDEGNLIEVW